MNKFTIKIRTELNLDNFRRRFDNSMIVEWLKIWGIKYDEMS